MKAICFIIVLFAGSFISTAQNIIQGEYYFNTDPGPGNAIPFSFISQSDTVNQLLSISTAGLAPGPHLLCMRTKNSPGIWSHHSSRIFHIAEPFAQFNVTGTEYFFDTDPGEGNGIPVSINNPGDTVNQQLSISTSGLAAGPHTLCIRSKNSLGIWSHSASRILCITDLPVQQPVTAAEYFFDTDPGQGNGIALLIPQGDTINASFQLINPFSSGLHRLVVRTRDAGGQWSHQEEKAFNVCSNYGANSDFNYFVNRRTVYFNNTSQYDTAFRWEFGDGTFTTSQRNPAHTYAAAGLYNARLISYNNCATDTFMQVIPAEGLQTIFPNYSADTNIYTGYVRGIGFQPGCTVRLQKPGSPDILADTTIVGSSTSLAVKFKFNHNPSGQYNVIAENPGGIIIDTLYNAFSLQPNITRIMSLSYSGQKRARTGRAASGEFTITNHGNTTVFFVPFFVYFTGDTSLHVTISTNMTLDPTVIPPISAIIPPAHAYNIDDPANPNAIGGQRLIAGVIPQMGPGESQSLSVSGFSSSPACHKVKVKVGEPLDNGLVNPFTNSCNFLPKELKCVMDVMGLIPGLGCAVGFAGWACAANNMASNWAVTGSTGNAKWDFLASTGTTLLQCVPGVSTVQGAMKLSVQAANALANGGALYGDCYQNGQAANRPVNEVEICWSNSYDPNEKTGPQGITADNYINKYQPVSYNVEFENVDSATAPAATVLVVDTIDKSTFDLSTFKLHAFGFGDSIYIVPDEYENFYMEDIDLRTSRGIWLRIMADLDTSGLLKWSFTSYDTTTYDLVSDPQMGFLPPNVNSPEGEGFISFSVKPKLSLGHEDVISNGASIYFDNNPPIITNAWINTIDTVKPVSSVQPLAATQSDTLFEVISSGTDAEAGIMEYILYASINDSAYRIVHYGAPDTLLFEGRNGDQYEFFSQARDRADNFEDTAHVADAITIVPVGIEEQNAQYIFNIYPNPASQSVTMFIQSDWQEEIEVALYSMNGTMHDTWKVRTNSNILLPMEKLSSGLYYLKAITSGNEMLVKKVIVID